MLHEERSVAPGELWATCGALLADDARIAQMSAAARARGRPEAAAEIARALLELAGGSAT